MARLVLRCKVEQKNLIQNEMGGNFLDEISWGGNMLEDFDRLLNNIAPSGRVKVLRMLNIPKSALVPRKLPYESTLKKPCALSSIINDEYNFAYSTNGLRFCEKPK
jgi:hypothetical protein